MADEVSGQEAFDLRFVIAVRDRAHLDAVLGSLRRVPSVLQAQRVVSGVGREA
jgi:GTP pyrophosphokinase